MFNKGQQLTDKQGNLFEIMMVTKRPEEAVEYEIAAVALRDSWLVMSDKEITENFTVKLDEFTIAYIECALWSSNDTTGNYEFLTENYDITDISKETLQVIVKDCGLFQAKSHELITVQSIEQSGHDFWLTRNGHGAGFWDRGLGDIGEVLTKLSNEFGECTLYVGDDGRIYIT